MPETPVRKKPATKVATKRTVKKAPAKKATTKRVTQKTVATARVSAAAVSIPPLATSVTALTRKAPTAIAATAASDSRSRLYLGISGAVFLVVLGVSAAIGFSDKGAIVVSEQFEKRLQAADEQERQVIENITLPKPTENNQPLNGLVGTGKSPAPAPAPVPEPIASSTESTATSTDAGVVEGGEEAMADDTTPSEPNPTEENSDVIE